MQALKTTGKAGPYEKEYFHKDGSRHWMVIAGAGLGGGGIVVYCTDVGDRKLAERAAQISEERSRLILDAARDYAILTTDSAGHITSWSRGAEAVLGWTAGEAIGQDIAMTFTAEDQARRVPEQERLIAKEKGAAPDVRWHVRKDGATVFIEGVVRAVQHGFLKVGQDITERRQADERLRESEERLRVALAAAQMGTWLWRIPEDKQIVDESLRRLMGLTVEEKAISMEQF